MDAGTVGGSEYRYKSVCYTSESVTVSLTVIEPPVTQSLQIFIRSHEVSTSPTHIPPGGRWDTRKLSNLSNTWQLILGMPVGCHGNLSTGCNESSDEVLVRMGKQAGP